jgi:hypothetical protein
LAGGLSHLTSALFSFIALLSFVLIITPHLLVEAFNPVTTNLPLMVLALLLLKEAKKLGDDDLKQ